jgi:hypothetical protein
MFVEELSMPRRFQSISLHPPHIHMRLKVKFQDSWRRVAVCDDHDIVSLKIYLRNLFSIPADQQLILSYEDPESELSPNTAQSIRHSSLNPWLFLAADVIQMSSESEFMEAKQCLHPVLHPVLKMWIAIDSTVTNTSNQVPSGITSK